MDTKNPDISALSEDELEPQKRTHPLMTIRLDREMADNFDAELRRHGLIKNRVVKGWVRAWLAKVAAQHSEQEAA